MTWAVKRIARRDCDLLVAYVCGPVVVGEYHFTMYVEDGAAKSELLNSISDGVKFPMKTMQIAQEMASFALSEMFKIATGKWIDKAHYFEQRKSIIDSINLKLQKEKNHGRQTKVHGHSNRNRKGY